MITAGFITFVVGSVAGMLSEIYGMLIFGRMLQAWGSVVIPAISGIIPARYFPPETRGRAMGISMTGGKMADSKGVSFLFYIAVSLYLLCFLLLSSFTGTSPELIAIFLIK